MPARAAAAAASIKRQWQRKHRAARIAARIIAYKHGGSSAGRGISGWRRSSWRAATHAARNAAAATQHQ